MSCNYSYTEYRGILRFFAGISPMAKFRLLLARTYVNRPLINVMQKIETQFFNRVLVVETPDGALSLYEHVKNMPTSTLKAEVKESVGITVNGPLSEQRATILSGATLSGRPVVIKLDDSAGREYDMVGHLELHAHDGGPHPAHLVNCTALKDLEHTTQNEATGFLEKKVWKAIVMPMYCCSLAALPQLEALVILMGLERMVHALEYIHEKGYVHMDIKSDNVFVDAEGNWTLGDFGSCTRVNEPVAETTRVFHPLVLIGKPAQTSFDYDMLAVMIAVELSKNRWKDQLYDDSGVIITGKVTSALAELRYSASEAMVTFVSLVLDRATFSCEFRAVTSV